MAAAVDRLCGHAEAELNLLQGAVLVSAEQRHMASGVAQVAICPATAVCLGALRHPAGLLLQVQ